MRLERKELEENIKSQGRSEQELDEKELSKDNSCEVEVGKVKEGKIKAGDEEKKGMWNGWLLMSHEGMMWIMVGGWGFGFDRG